MQLGNSDLLNFVLQISTSNRNFIQLLLNHECISHSQLCSDILKVMHEFYHTPVESRKFRSALNSFINCYLQFVFSENKKLNFIPKEHVNIFNIGDFFEAVSREFSHKTPSKNVCNSGLALVEDHNFLNYVDRLIKFINHSSLNIDFDHIKIIKNSKLFDVCANVNNTHSEDALILSNPKSKNNQICAVDDFQTFLSPLKEDYTKSSQGYICQNKIVDKNPLISAVKLLTDDDLLNLSDESEIDESRFADDANYDPDYDNIMSRYFCSLKNLSSNSETSLNRKVSNSDSDDSITFSDYFGECMYGFGTKPIKSNISRCCDVFSSESDSEDCEIFDNSLGNKFFKVSSSNISGLSELNDFDLNETFDSDLLEICDKNSSPGNQSLEESVIMDFSFVSNSLSQVSLQTNSAYFDGFINPCFEDDEDVILENELLRNVNDEWERSMQNVPCEPREPKKVAFLPMPNLVTIKTFEPDDDGYHFGLYLLNQVRFKNRIEEFEQIIRPYLSAKHRASIYENYFSNNSQLM